jgi:phospholipid N-methyltransferase
MGQNLIRESKLSLQANGRPEWSNSGLRRFALFAANFIRHPKAIGSIFPSSSFVVRRALAHVPWQTCDVLVEFGPGTGQFTREILRRMRPDATLICIDVNEMFVRFLQATHHDRRLRVIEGSAVHIRAILQRLSCSKADCVVAGIPFRPLPAKMRQQIIAETHGALSDGGMMLVYQVSAVVLPHLRSVFRTVEREFEPINLLPTHVFRCLK